MIRPWAYRAMAGAFLAVLAGCSATKTIREVPASSPRAVSASSAADARAASGGVWGKAEEVPGTAARNTGGDADVGVSCASAGNCSAGGNYEHDFSDARSFVVGEKNGTWGKAERVLINGTGVGLISLSCASAGNCSAGGEYVDTSDLTQAFVVGEKNGTWGKAEEVPGTAVLNKGGYATLNVLSCASAGNCSAGGTYSYASGRYQAFVAGERNGTWGKAEEVPGIAALNRGGHAVTGSVSCAAAGNCSAGGFYTDGSGHQQAFVAGETNGAWGKAEKIPGTGALNQGRHAGIEVSCASAGNCGVGGYDTDGSGRVQAFVAGERDGTWGKAEEVPGTAGLNKGGDAETQSVSCAAVDNCSASGFYTDGSGHQQAFVVNET